jgi:hypothetical protein
MHASVVVMPLFSSAACLNDLAMLSEAAENRDGAGDDRLNRRRRLPTEVVPVKGHGVVVVGDLGVVRRDRLGERVRAGGRHDLLDQRPVLVVV